ncbi:MAG: hypothetical protein KatS3mg124_0480 [Porticoccaceae bacterium]|nr:MAG: hypothetical protein KatS3mg124_0480 [Porticoccaceae bacterium]
MALTAQQRKDLVQLYVAIPDRAPDASGLAFWAGHYESGLSLLEIATEMWKSPAAQALYPSFLTVEEIVVRIYENVLNRDPIAEGDTEGVDFWVGRWNANTAALGSDAGAAATILEMIEAINNYSGSDPVALAAQELFFKKVEFGEWFATTFGSNDLALAELGFQVLENGGSVEDAKVQVQLDPPADVVLTAGTDVINPGDETGNNDDIIRGTESTLNTSDVIDGGDGDDTLSLTISGNDSFFAAPTIDNIELVTVTAGGTGTLSGVLDLSDMDFNDPVTLETRENQSIDWAFEDIQSVNNTSFRVVDTDDGWIGYGYDANAYSGDDTADLTVAEVDCLDVDFYNSTNLGGWSQVDQVNLHSLTNGEVTITDFNYIWSLDVGTSWTTLIIDGDADLTIEKALNSQVTGGNTVTLVDASGLQADLDIDIEGQGAVSGAVGSAGAMRVAPLTIIGAQGNNDIGVDSGELSPGRNGVNGSYTTFEGNDRLVIGDLEALQGWSWDGEDCHDDDARSLRLRLQHRLRRLHRHHRGRHGHRADRPPRRAVGQPRRGQ